MTETVPVDDAFRILRRRPITTEPLGYLASLDGIRAVAVAGVLLYHARFAWIPGGYLGVSMFFTLSGFLITSLLLREWAEKGAIDSRGFLARRFRRLLPASWLTLGLILVMGALGAWNADQLRALRTDVPTAVIQIVNWHFVFAGRSYGDAFAAPSPVEHFWSLAIEQQFYFALPVLLFAVLSLRRGRSQRARLQVLIALLAALVVASAWWNSHLAAGSIDRAYFGTDSRVFEILIGSLLACATLRRLRVASRWARVVAIVAGVVALGVTVVLWNRAALSDPSSHPWAFLASAACTVALTWGALQPGPLQRVLALPPLQYLGRISYGVYLLHWPIFLWLSPARTGLSQWPLFAVRVALTLVLASVMFRVVETPLRAGALLRGRRGSLLAAAAASVLLLASPLVTRNVPELDSLARAAMEPSTEAPSTTPPPPPLRTVVVGDELAESLGTRLASVEGFDASAIATPGCGLTIGGYVARGDNTAERDVDRCRGEHERWVAETVEIAPEVVLVHGGLRDVSDRRLRPEEPWAGPGDPRIDDFLRTDVGELVDGLSDSGAEVVLLGMPPVANSTVPPAVPHALPPDPTRAALQQAQHLRMIEGVPPSGFRENDPARVAHFNELLAAVAESRGIRFMDPEEVTSRWPEGHLDPAMRPDGVGYSETAAEQIGEWLLPQLRERVEPAPRADASPVLDPNAPLPEPPPAAPRRVVPPGVTPDVLVVGDSVGFNVGYGLRTWSESAGGVRIRNAARLGCPVARGGEYRFKGDLVQLTEECDWAEYFPEQLNATRPAVVVLSSGIWEVVDRRVPGDDRFRHVGDPALDRYLLREFLAAIDVLGSDGAHVVVLTQPHFEAGLDQGFQDLPESDPERTDRFNELLREAVGLRPGVATLVDFQAWLAGQSGGEVDPEHRPDGLHFADAYSPTIGAWLGPQLIALARG